MLDIIYNRQAAIIKSFDVADTDKFDSGEWVIFSKTTGLPVKQTGAYSAATQGVVLPVLLDNIKRLDTQAIGRVTVLLGKSYYCKTDKVEAVTILAGDPLTIKDGKITKAVVGTGVGEVSSFDVIGFATTPNLNGEIEFTRA
jgi:hypothetical protein